MLKRIKKIIRDGIWETNSSSSHSITIYGEDYIRSGDPEFNLCIINNILYVPKIKEDFGWDWRKTNYCEEKLQYVCGLMCSDYSGKGQKEIKKLKNVLISYLGIQDVVFEWDTEYLELIKKGNDPEDCYRAVPDIDHQSRSDSYDEICESRKTIIDFIFSRRSWWYGGNDNSSEPGDFYKETVIEKGTPNAIASIECGGNLGRVDIELFDFPGNIFKEICNDDIVENLVYNLDTKRIELDSKSSLFSWSSRIQKDEDKYRILYIQHETCIVKDGHVYLLFSGSQKWEDAVHEEYVNQKKEYDKKKISSYPSYDVIYKDLVRSGKMIEGKDYALVLVSIKTEEFGEL